MDAVFDAFLKDEKGTLPTATLVKTAYIMAALARYSLGESRRWGLWKVPFPPLEQSGHLLFHEIARLPDRAHYVDSAAGAEQLAEEASPFVCLRSARLAKALVVVNRSGWILPARLMVAMALAEFAWKPWSLDWNDPATGEHRITSRAVDTAGRIQPAMNDPLIANKRTYWESNGQVTRRVRIG